MSGILVIDKPAGWTSHDVVARVRRLTGERRIGHAGTLDPSATGVLVLCFGGATRLLEYVAGGRKQYSAEIELGVETSTDDADGDVLRRMGTDGITREQVEHAVSTFVGTISQMPPNVSAIKVGGVRAYAVARAGMAPDLSPRLVTIYRMDVVAFEPPVLVVDVECGSGTYIRSIARDLGAALGVGGHVRTLRRLRVGQFRLDDALTLSQFESLVQTGEWGNVVKPAASALSDWPVVQLDQDGERLVRQGRRFEVSETSMAVTRAAGLDRNGRLVAVLTRIGAYWQPIKVLVS